jgi:hypothetical protein
VATLPARVDGEALAAPPAPAVAEFMIVPLDRVLGLDGSGPE